jgi:hypothetical protein
LIDAGVAVLENEKIERHIMKNVPGGHNLFVQVLLRKFNIGTSFLLKRKHQLTCSVLYGTGTSNQDCQENLHRAQTGRTA